MTSSGARSRCATLAAAVLVGFGISLVGCASLGPITPVTVSTIGSVAGTWQGVLYGSGSEPEYIDLTIREDGSYEVVSRRRMVSLAEEALSWSATDASSFKAKRDAA